MAAHASILSWKISWREEPGRLQSMCHKVGHDWAHTHTNLHSQQLHTRVAFTLHPYYYVLLFLVLIIAKLYLIVFLIYISRMISSIKNSLIYLLAICMSSLEKCQIRSFADFLFIGLFGFFAQSCMKCLCILDLNTLAESMQIFSHPICYLFIVFFLFMCRTSLILYNATC